MTIRPPASPAVLPLTLALGAALLAGACGGRSQTRSPTSGSPEADRRAELRVGEAGDGDAGNQAEEQRTLFERLGGAAGITSIVDDMTERVVNDPRVNFERRDVRVNWLGKKYDAWRATPENVQHFKDRMVEFITLAAGGSTEYRGREMGPLHKDMQITNAEFDAFVGDLKTTMDRLGYGRREARDLIAIIETTRKMIVSRE